MEYMQIQTSETNPWVMQKGKKIEGAIKNMQPSQYVWIRKEDLSCFYTVARKLGMRFTRKAHDGGYYMALIETGVKWEEEYLAKRAARKALGTE